MNKLKLILASQSPRRKELLSHLGIAFDVVVKSIDEERDGLSPVDYVKILAREKGEAVFEHIRQNDLYPNPLIVSADTTVVLNEKIYGKPSSVAEARQILLELSGKTHLVYTGVAIFNAALGSHVFHDASEVEFAKISPEVMEHYLATGDSLDKAGAYGIQGAGLLFIKSLRGSYSNVVGFPLERFVAELKKYLKVDEKNAKTWRENLFL